MNHATPGHPLSQDSASDQYDNTHGEALKGTQFTPSLSPKTSNYPTFFLISPLPPDTNIKKPLPYQVLILTTDQCNVDQGGGGGNYKKNEKNDEQDKKKIKEKFGTKCFKTVK